MPVNNGEKFIAESIGSVMQQSYPEWELIIIDDGSADNTKNIVQLFCEADKRIKYFYQNKSGQGAARNKGIKLSNASLIAFLDADDLWFSHKLENQLKLMLERSVDLVFSDVVVINENGKTIRESWGVTSDVYKGNEGLIVFLRENKAPLLTVLARKENILRVNCFEESETIQYGEDYDLWIRMLIDGSVLMGTAEKLAAYRKHDAQSTQNKLALLQVVKRIKSISPADKRLLEIKNTALRLWIRKLLKVYMQNVGREDIDNIIVHFPLAFEQYFFLFLSRIFNPAFLVQILLLYCRRSIKKYDLYT